MSPCPDRPVDDHHALCRREPMNDLVQQDGSMHRQRGVWVHRGRLGGERAAAIGRLDAIRRATLTTTPILSSSARARIGQGNGGSRF